MKKHNVASNRRGRSYAAAYDDSFAAYATYARAWATQFWSWLWKQPKGWRRWK